MFRAIGVKSISFRKAAAVSNVCTEEICVVLRGKGRDDTTGKDICKLCLLQGKGKITTGTI